ncbi:hypothetical protein MASR1M107_18450 [Ignavibacteriales bacterium]
MTIKSCLTEKKTGFLYGNRLILPFKARFLKVVVEKDIITDFSPSSKGINIVEEDLYTSLYFLEYRSLRDTLSKYENIKLVVVEKDDDIFNVDKHMKLAVYKTETHVANIEETEHDILFIE